MTAEERCSAPGAHLSRRSMFAAGAGLLIAAPAVAAPDGPAAARARGEALEAEINAMDWEAPEEMLKALWTHEDATLRGTIRTRADAAAKLKGVAVSFQRGLLENGADGEALADAIRWLEAN